MTEPTDPATVPVLGSVEPFDESSAPVDAEQPADDGAGVDLADQPDEQQPAGDGTGVDLADQPDADEPNPYAGQESLNAMAMALVGANTTVSGEQLAALAQQLNPVADVSNDEPDPDTQEV